MINDDKEWEREKNDCNVFYFWFLYFCLSSPLTNYTILYLTLFFFVRFDCYLFRFFRGEYFLFRFKCVSNLLMRCTRQPIHFCNIRNDNWRIIYVDWDCFMSQSRHMECTVTGLVCHMTTLMRQHSTVLFSGVYF